LRIENLIDQAEKLKEKSSYPESLRLFKKAFKEYTEKCDYEGMLDCLFSLGDLYRMTGDFGLAIEKYSLAMVLARKQSKTISVADARVGLGLSFRALGKWKEALNHIRKSERTYQKAGDKEGLAFSLWAEAGALRIQGNIREAIKIFIKSLLIFKRLKNKQGVGYCLCGLGGSHRVAGLIRHSLKYYSEANRLFSKVKDRFGIAYSYCGIGNAYRMMKDYKRSLANFSKAIALYKKIGDRVSYSYTLWSLGTTYKMMRNFQKARENFLRSMLLFKKTKDPRGNIYCRLGLGEISFLSGKKVSAMKYLNVSLADAINYKFAVERCHAETILSCINEKTDDKCYNRLGLELKFQELPFNIP